MISPKYLILGIAVFILTLQGVTQGAFLDMIMPGWHGQLGHVLCIAGGYIVQPVWDFGFAKIPIPVGDDLAAGLLVAGIAGWFIKRTAWTLKRKLIATAIFFTVGMVVYKAVGLVILWYAEVQYGMSDCIGQFQLGPIIVEWAWYSSLYFFMIIVGSISVITAVLAYKKKGG
jgi:hypothetical protein